MRKTLIYTFCHSGKNYICTRQQLIKILSEKIYYTTTIVGSFGVDSANYEKGEKVANQLAREKNWLLCIGSGYSFKVYTHEDFMRNSENYRDSFIDIRKGEK